MVSQHRLESFFHEMKCNGMTSFMELMDICKEACFEGLFYGLSEDYPAGWLEATEGAAPVTELRGDYCGIIMDSLKIWVRSVPPGVNCFRAVCSAAWCSSAIN